MADLDCLMTFISNIKELKDNAEGQKSKSKSKRKTRVVKLLRKSKGGNRQQEPMSFDAQNSVCDNFIRKQFGKVKIVSVIKSRESGVALRRPHLIQAARICVKEDAILVVAKVDRLARNIVLFMTLLLSGIRIYFTEYQRLI